MEGDENPYGAAFVEVAGEAQPVAELADPSESNAVAFGRKLDYRLVETLAQVTSG